MPKLTDLDAVQQFLDGVEEIRSTEAKSGYIHVWISDGVIRYVNAEKPPVPRRSKGKQPDQQDQQDED